MTGERSASPCTNPATEPSGEPGRQLAQGAVITAAPKGPCEAEVTVVYAPDAVPETTVTRIVDSFRTTGG